MSETFQATVGEAEAGQRLDRFLADAAPALSRARITALIESGHVTSEAASGKLRPSQKTRAGEVYLIMPPPPAPAEPEPEAIPLAIAFEDEAVIVVDKPAGMTVHPAPGQETGTLVNALLAHCGDSLSGVGGVKRPGIVHRIDKDTSGLIVAAKSDRAHQALAAQFADHSVERAYRALVWGLPSPPAGVIETTIGRDRQDRKRMAVGGSGGKRAVTHYEVANGFGLGAAEVVCRLETGRTHQIRVHLAHAGWPLIGDPVYGRVTPARRNRLPEPARGAALSFSRQALHAGVLGFRHPETDAIIRLESAWPQDMADLAEMLAAGATNPK